VVCGEFQSLVEQLDGSDRGVGHPGGSGLVGEDVVVCPEAAEFIALGGEVAEMLVVGVPCCR
jgi:hypothetical protein